MINYNYYEADLDIDYIDKIYNEAHCHTKWKFMHDYKQQEIKNTKDLQDESLYQEYRIIHLPTGSKFGVFLNFDDENSVTLEMDSVMRIRSPKFVIFRELIQFMLIYKKNQELLKQQKEKENDIAVITGLFANWE